MTSLDADLGGAFGKHETRIGCLRRVFHPALTLSGPISLRPLEHHACPFDGEKIATQEAAGAVLTAVAYPEV